MKKKYMSAEEEMVCLQEFKKFGDPCYLNPIFESNKDFVFKEVLKRKDCYFLDTDDIVQEVYLSIIQKLKKFEPSTKNRFYTYFGKTFIHRAINRYKTYNKRQKRDANHFVNFSDIMPEFKDRGEYSDLEFIDTIADEKTNTELDVLRLELAKLLGIGINKLPKDQADSLIDHFYLECKSDYSWPLIRLIRKIKLDKSILEEFL